MNRLRQISLPPIARGGLQLDQAGAWPMPAAGGAHPIQIVRDAYGLGLNVMREGRG